MKTHKNSTIHVGEFFLRSTPPHPGSQSQMNYNIGIPDPRNGRILVGGHWNPASGPPPWKAGRSKTAPVPQLRLPEAETGDGFGRRENDVRKGGIHEIHLVFFGGRYQTYQRYQRSI